MLKTSERSAQIQTESIMEDIVTESDVQQNFSLRVQLSDYGFKGYLRFFKIGWETVRLIIPILLEVVTVQKSYLQLPLLQKFIYRVLTFFIKTNTTNNAHSLRNYLTKLGPTFIKIGQTLSTRPDLLPLPYIRELTLLQDQVPCFSNRIAWALIKQELGSTPNKLFLSIDGNPIAAASIGQVYKARLKTGQDVVIKVQRPNLEHIIKLDLAILRFITSKLQNYFELLNKIELLSVISEFEKMLLEEIDYEKEVDNATKFKENFSEWKDIVHVPHIYSEFCSQRIITMEYIEGVKITDIESLNSEIYSSINVINLLTRTYLKQLLEDGFFHADPHAGNLRVMPNGKLAFFDFGMVGHITQEMRSKMIDAFFHIVERDAAKLTNDAVELGFLKPENNSKEFIAVIESILSEYIGISLGKIKFRGLIETLTSKIEGGQIRIPANFTFIIRAISTIEGIGFLTDPEFSFFNVARPHAKEFMLRKESAYIRNQIIGKFLRGEKNNISLEKVWNLTKLFYRTHFKKSN